MSSQDIFKSSSRRQANQKRPAFVIKEINPPDCTWSYLKNFKLASIPAIFEPSSYQRSLNTPHTYRIVSSIVNNTFYDNTLRVVKIGKNRYSVIDGQHRLAALWILHNQYDVQTYDLAVQIFDNDEQREVFRKINSGKTLTHGDILKSYATGDIKFFDELKEYAQHNKVSSSPAYIVAFQAIWFSRGNRRAAKPSAFKEILDSITSDEITHAARLAIASRDVHLVVQTHKVFGSILFRIAMCIGMERNYSIDEYKKMLTVFVTDEKASQLVADAKSGHFDAAMDNIVKILEGKH